MTIEIQVALIGAAATVLAAIIATGGAALIFAHRGVVIRLARQVEAYHAQEGRLVEALISAAGQEPTEALVKQRRGAYRKDASDAARPSMTALEARKIRRRYFSVD
ncbi:hypothetical protein [Thiocapsa roseopersicina]|uniref:Uncharacterized protein n=1 Tax=Thiocapsa roseopersicina TaxID=1058 RepID=A0A1H2QC41_THIRO|nr:hypothetical protein [Thiocapsa roseopersicina]SDW04827.1 hypothetical protein SAMN05421783_101216 [Thiocapsa roseopersicina]